MTPGVRPFLAGNWKMNGLTASLREVETMRRAVEDGVVGDAEIALFVPATLLAPAAHMLSGSSLGVGAQNCHWRSHGAYTGDISAPMIRDAGATYVIAGHSERRTAYGETDEMVRAKAEAGIAAGLTAVVCVGETSEERDAGDAIRVITTQLRGSLPPAATPSELVAAYEPVWAIGTGLTLAASEVLETHATIRGLLMDIYGGAGARIRILYGGSVKPANARELLGLPNVDGALVGGASLKAADFLAIAATYAAMA